MNSLFKKIISCTLSAAMASAMVTITAVNAAAADTIVPIIEGDNVEREWKFSFGTDERTDYMRVPKTAHPVMGDLETGAETGYGFVGTHEEDFNFPGAYDALTMVKGHVTKLKETTNGVGSIGSEPGTDGFGYPLKFAMYCDTGDYFRVALTLTNLDEGDATDVTVYSERKHVVVSHETITEGDEMKLEFSVVVQPNYFKGDGKRFIDDMLNISVAGRNVALKDMTVQKVESGTTLWVLGDSTVTDGGNTLPLFNLIGCTGTGASLSKYLPKNIAVSNQGEGGLNAWDNPHFAVADENIKAGDYMYVQYGHNHKSDGVHGYVCALDKYYQSCKRADATLVIVSPIERHQKWQYNAATKTWSDSLGGFARAGKGYVDCMIYGGEAAAMKYAQTYDAAALADADGDGNADGDSAGEKAAEAYKETVLAENSTERKITNIAYVDMNTYTLRWLEGISKEGMVMGEKVTNHIGLVDFYYQDLTHPNDLGSEGLAEGMFLNAAAKIEEYPALAGLLKTYEGEIPADDSTASGRRASHVPQSIMDTSWAWGEAYPSAVSQYKYPTQIRRVNFNEDGTLENMEVQLLDKSIMPTYGRGIVELYDENGKLIKTAFSNAAANNDKGYVGWIDNASDPGVQVLGFDGNDLNVNDGASYKAFIWSMLDQEGYPLTMQPYTDGTCGPVEFDYLLTDDKKEGPECFHYYGLKAGGSIDGKNGWWSDIADKKSMCEGDMWYGAFSGNGRLAHTIPMANGKYMTDGIIGVEGKIRNVNGKFTARLCLPGAVDALECFSVTDGKIKDNAGVEHAITNNTWTAFKYTLDIDKGVSKLNINDSEGEWIEVPQLSKLLASENKPAQMQEVDLLIENGKLELTDFTVKNVTRLEPLEKHNVTLEHATGSDNTMGALTGAGLFAEGSTQAIGAAANGGYRFIGWYTDAQGENQISTQKNIEIKTPCNDLTLYAKFEVHEGFYMDESFDDYEVGEKIRAYGNDKPAPPEDVRLGGFIFSAGHRNNGAINPPSYISIAEENGNRYMTCAAGNPSNNVRGVKFTLASLIDFAAAKTENKTIVWEFDYKADNDTGMTVFGKEGDNDIEIGRYPKGNLTASADWVNVKFIFDTVYNKQYVITTGENGDIEKIIETELRDNIKLMGVSFYDYGVGSTLFDNMKIYDLGTLNTTARMPQTAKITAPAGAKVNIAGNEYTADENGIISATLTEGAIM